MRNVRAEIARGTRCPISFRQIIKEVPCTLAPDSRYRAIAVAGRQHRGERGRARSVDVGLEREYLDYYADAVTSTDEGFLVVGYLAEVARYGIEFTSCGVVCRDKGRGVKGQRSTNMY